MMISCAVKDVFIHQWLEENYFSAFHSCPILIMFFLTCITTTGWNRNVSIPLVLITSSSAAWLEAYSLFTMSSPLLGTLHFGLKPTGQTEVRSFLDPVFIYNEWLWGFYLFVCFLFLRLCDLYRKWICTETGI